MNLSSLLDSLLHIVTLLNWGTTFISSSSFYWLSVDYINMILFYARCFLLEKQWKRQQNNISKKVFNGARYYLQKKTQTYISVILIGALTATIRRSIKHCRRNLSPLPSRRLSPRPIRSVSPHPVRRLKIVPPQLKIVSPQPASDIIAPPGAFSEGASFYNPTGLF